MAQPRVLFMSGAGASGSSWVAWRLVSANNRELARSAMVYDDYAAAMASVKVMRDRTTELKSRVGLDGGSGQWGWTVQLDGDAAARSSRRYQRERECRYSLEQFLMSLPVAVVTDDVVNLSAGRGRRMSKSAFLTVDDRRGTATPERQR